MTAIPLRRVAVATAAVFALALPSVSAHAAPSVPDASTPVPVDTSDGHVMSYVINTKAKPGHMKRVETAVQRAGGTVVQSWPQIGVVVAHADTASFLPTVRAENAVLSAGPTRTAAVTEGTPGRAGTARSDASSYKKTPADPTGQLPETKAAAAASDPRESEQWNNQMVKADQAHRISDGSRDVVVGVLDSGIDDTHPDLTANVDRARSVNCAVAGRPDTTAGAWRDSGSPHGTHVAGTIAAARNGTGIVGVAPDVRLASIKVVNDQGFIYPEYAICGFLWAAEHDVDVTNNSYFIDPFEFWCGDQPDQAAAMEAVRRAVTYATGRGVVHAAAAGNGSRDLTDQATDDTSPNDSTPVKRQINGTCKDIPTQLPGVVTVSAVDQTATKPQFSNFGYSVIDVAAPGDRVLSTVPMNTQLPAGSPSGYAVMTGTSMASPHVAGVLALLKSTHPDATPAQLIEMVRSQADDLACPNSYPPSTSYPEQQFCTGPLRSNSFYGEGIVDALDAVTTNR